MELKVTGAEAMKVSEETFGVAYNEPLIHQVIHAYLDGGHLGTKRQKNRSDTRGGGAKPWRQKGTGRARAGTTRSNIWRGGGKAFAASPHVKVQKINKKMYRGAMRSILSQLIRDDRVLVVDNFDVDRPKTKLVAEKLHALKLVRALVIAEEINESLYLASRNITGVRVVDVQGVDPVSLVTYDRVVMTVGAVKKMEEMFR